MGRVNDKTKRVVAQIAPAVRVALGEEFGRTWRSNIGKIVAALKELGFDEVYDTAFAADMTVIEERRNLLKDLKQEKTFLYLLLLSRMGKICRK